MDSPEIRNFDPRVQELLEKVHANLGQLIRLRKLSPKGEEMQLEMRYIPVPSDVYPESREGLSGLLLVDVFVKDEKSESGFKSIAFRDWMLNNEDQATSPLCICSGLHSKETRDIEANRQWQDRDVGTQVADGYNNVGLGTFMTAVSLQILDRIGVKEVAVRRLVGEWAEDDSRKSSIISLWRKFGVEQQAKPYPIKELILHPEINHVISEFF